MNDQAHYPLMLGIQTAIKLRLELASDMDPTVMRSMEAKTYTVHPRHV